MNIKEPVAYQSMIYVKMLDMWSDWSICSKNYYKSVKNSNTVAIKVRELYALESTECIVDINSVASATTQSTTQSISPVWQDVILSPIINKV